MSQLDFEHGLWEPTSLSDHTPPRAPLSIRTPAHVTHQGEPLLTSHTTDGYPPISHIPTIHSPSSERFSHLGGDSRIPPSTSSITSACTLPVVGDGNKTGGDPFTVPITHDLRPMHMPTAVTTPPQESCRRERATRKQSWGLDDDVGDIASGEALLVGRPGEHVGCEAMSDWNSPRSSMESGTAVSTNSLRTLCIKEAKAGGDPDPWDTGPSPGRDDQKPLAATLDGDAFLQRFQRSDTSLSAPRSEEWMFGREKADAPGLRFNGLTAGGVAAPTIGPGTFEIWRCHVAGRFCVERLELQSEPPRPPSNRIVIKHIMDPYSVNCRGGPGVIVHKHSRAKGFSIFRRHGLFKREQVQKSRQSPRYLDTSQSILLATRTTQEQYTSTKTTGRLMTHGLLKEWPTDGGAQQGGSVAPTRCPHTQNSAREDQYETKTLQEKEMRRIDEERKEGNGTARQTSNGEGVGVITKNGPWPYSGATAEQQNSSTSYPTMSTPTSTVNQSSIISADSVPPSTPSSLPPPHPQVPSTSHSYRMSLSKIWDTEDEDGDSPDDYCPPARKRNCNEVYGSLPPPHHERARNLIRSASPQTAKTLRPIFPRIFSGRGGNSFGWLRGSKTTDIAPSPVPWMLMDNPNSLVNNSDIAGFAPPRSSPHDAAGLGEKYSEGPRFPVPRDSVYMLLPLFAGETDAEFQPEDMSRYEVPLESRKYLLVYYAPFDEWMAGAGTKKVKPPAILRSFNKTKNKTVFLNSFHVSAHLMSYQDFDGSGLRLPATGLSVTGPLNLAQPPNIEAGTFRDPVAIARCSGRDNGIEFFPGRLEQFGLCRAVEEERTTSWDNLKNCDTEFELSALGRAVVEMVWVGAMAVTSFGTV